MSGTIYALSSGAPPAAIAIVRISGARADAALEALTGRLPEPRRATLVAVRSGDGEVLDHALALRFPGPNSATGEDLAELHLHGGRAVVASVLRALGASDGLREAEPGEFTRRAFENGRIDLAEAEGLADLLAAETQAQRRAAQLIAGGALSRNVEAWRAETLELAAALEAALDFGDEGDVGEELPAGWRERLAAVRGDVEAALLRAPAERLREGVRVAIAGPPNVGKSSLLNALAGRDAAITSEIAGTTRDVIEAPTAIGGVAFLLTDTAGLRESDDRVEAVGIERARQAVGAADLVLWLGAPEDAPEDAIIVHPKADLDPPDARSHIAVSAMTGAGLAALAALLAGRARLLLPAEGEVALNARHRSALAEVVECLCAAGDTADLIIAAEALRQARVTLDRVTGRAGVEDMLDALFGRFCIGK
ncbi:MAG TPA: tRNA uridine-5-carboxymethylaminomethyl(34) synthesis GTPase MnmE [Allosphingosinicella sp.]|nr:tRNA uridine-5-carboxymethylaminomethyl(34) synthesis GTPase MnmE [Allosphingosinicella sp.]